MDNISDYEDELRFLFAERILSDDTAIDATVFINLIKNIIESMSEEEKVELMELLAEKGCDKINNFNNINGCEAAKDSCSTIKLQETTNQNNLNNNNNNNNKIPTYVNILISLIVGIISGTILLPAAISAIGFTSGGIIGSSFAAKMMSVFSILNGGGVAAGGIVSTLQSVGAVGLSTTATAITSGATSIATFFGIKKLWKKKQI